MVLLSIAIVLLLGAVALSAYIAQPAPAARGGELVFKNSPVGLSANGTFIVGTYNIHGGRGRDNHTDLSRCADVIQNADIVGLQEVHAASHFGQACQADTLAESTGMLSLFAPARTRWFRDFRGNALLSRFDIKKWHRESLPDRSGRSYRCLLTAEVVMGGQSLALFVTHLHGREGREQQLETVFERFAQSTPAVLLGDFNTTSTDPLIKKLVSEFGSALKPVHPASDDIAGIDWIICRGLELVSAGVDHSDASDHPYCWAQLRFPTG